MIAQMVKFRSRLEHTEIIEIAQERASAFRAVSGLLQKYYLRTKEDDRFAGIYIWEDAEAMREYEDSDLAASLAEAYQVLEPPDIEIYEVDMVLREWTAHNC